MEGRKILRRGREVTKHGAAFLHVQIVNQTASCCESVADVYYLST